MPTTKDTEIKIIQVARGIRRYCGAKRPKPGTEIDIAELAIYVRGLTEPQVRAMCRIHAAAIGARLRLPIAYEGPMRQSGTRGLLPFGRDCKKGTAHTWPAHLVVVERATE